MNSEFKFPTLIGLGVLFIGLVAGVALVAKPQLFTTQATPTAQPQNITVTNLFGTSASIYWQTDQETTGFIQVGTNPTPNQTFIDDRDTAAPKPHLLHFVTLTNLIPNTTYYYKIVSGATTFPAKNPLSFQTPANTTISTNQPLIGTVLSSDLTEVNEALVALKLENNILAATVTKLAGNFILPLTIFPNFTATQSATLVIFNQQTSSKVKLQLPSTSILPFITLGKDIDLTPKIASPAAQVNKYDLNNDGAVNSLDLAIILKNTGPLRSEASKNPKEKRADLNGDGVVDQQDANFMNKVISQNFSR